MDIHNIFIADQKTLVFYAGKPIINRQMDFYDINGDDWDFSDATGVTMKVWEEREGGIQLIDWVDPDNLSISGKSIFLNAPATDTSIGLGKYYYEIAYQIAGGYEVLAAYGMAKFI
jgi:hypothetical protein